MEGDPSRLGYDPHFTDNVIAATGPKANTRLKEIMPSLLRHLHDFAREVNLTVAEWTAGVEMINEAGRMSGDKRNETGLLCDILGVESLVDEITAKVLLRDDSATPSAVLGPFYRENAPLLPNGESIVNVQPNTTGAEVAGSLRTRVSGRVLSVSRRPIPGAVVDVWHAGPNGLYEQQDETQPDMNLRGKFRTDDQGRYEFYCLRPTPYPIPDDGPAGRLLHLLDRHPYRPAHIHFIVTADGFRPLTTQVFDREDRYVLDDTVFAVKKQLLVDFKKREGDEKAEWELEFDFLLNEDGMK